MALICLSTTQEPSSLKQPESMLLVSSLAFTQVPRTPRMFSTDLSGRRKRRKLAPPVNTFLTPPRQCAFQHWREGHPRHRGNSRSRCRYPESSTCWRGWLGWAFCPNTSKAQGNHGDCVSRRSWGGGWRSPLGWRERTGRNIPKRLSEAVSIHTLC